MRKFIIVLFSTNHALLSTGYFSCAQDNFPHCLGDSMNTMFIQVNTDSYLSSENSGMVGINGSQEQGFCKEEDGGMITDEGAFMSEDDDLNVSYTCDICNKSIKGKVMLQVNTALK